MGRLSALTVARARKPGYLGDGGGLYLQITKSGSKSKRVSKSWIFRYSASGKRHEMGLGPLGSVPLTQARAVALACRQQLAAGLDPKEQRKIARNAAALEAAKAITFKECAERYIEAHRAGWRNAKHAAQWPSSLKAYAYPVIGTLSVQAVDTGLVLKVLESIWTTRPETASRVRGRIEATLDWAKARGYRTGENPARWRGHLENLLPKRSKVRRVRHHPALPYADVPAFMRALRALDGVAAATLEFLILTVTRSGEVRGARFAEIRDGVWIVPAERMKGGQPHRVPLSNAALAVVERMRATQTGEYVFPARDPRKRLSDSAVAEVVKLARRDDGTPWMDHDGRPVVPHGFRSAFRDWAAERTAYPREVVELALAHAPRDTTEAAYLRGDALEKRRRLMDEWARYCGSEPAARGKVVPLRPDAA
jgi:integrase